MKGVLRKIRPFHGPIEPDPNWEMLGMTPDGRQLFKEVTTRSRPVPLNDDDGNRVYQRHLTTGQKLYPMNKPEIFDLERVFTLESEGNGNVRKVPYRPPTPEEIKAAEREGKVEAMKDRLAEVFVDADIEPEDLLAFLRERPYVPQAEIDAAQAAADEADEADELPYTDSSARRAEAEAEAQAATQVAEALPEPGPDAEVEADTSPATPEGDL